MKLFKDGVCKEITAPKPLARLKKEGWSETENVTKEKANDLDREALVAKAKELGLDFHHRTGTEKLAQMIAEKEA